MVTLATFRRPAGQRGGRHSLVTVRLLSANTQSPYVLGLCSKEAMMETERRPTMTNSETHVGVL